MVSSSSLSLPPAMEDGEYRNWAELPPELTSSILHRLGAIDILENAQKVCTTWCRVCKDPSMWRKIDMRNDLGEFRSMEYGLGIMCRHAVDRSQGGLLEIVIWYFGNTVVLNYIADSSRNLRSLKLAMCSSITDNGFGEAVGKLPLLEELEVTYCMLSAESLKVVGNSCPNLKTLKLNRSSHLCYNFLKCDDEALAIAETMPGLRHLQLFGNSLTDAGLNAILDNCPNLEHLDLRKCLNVYLVGDLDKQCSQRIKCFRRPNDSTHDYPYVANYRSDYDHYGNYSDDSDYDHYDIHSDYDPYGPF